MLAVAVLLLTATALFVIKGEMVDAAIAAALAVLALAGFRRDKRKSRRVADSL